MDRRLDHRYPVDYRAVLRSQELVQTMNDDGCIPWWIPTPAEWSLIDACDIGWGVWRYDLYNDEGGSE